MRFGSKGLAPANANILIACLFYPASILHPRIGTHRDLHRVGALSNIETVGVSASKTLALGGFHPYNPLTGIMLSRNETTGGARVSGLSVRIFGNCCSDRFGERALHGAGPTPGLVGIGLEIKTPSSPKSLRSHRK
jgi:hypothetical protein